LWTSSKLFETIKYFYNSKKVIASICHACGAVAKAGVLKGKMATVFPSADAKDVFKQESVDFVDQGDFSAEVDKGLDLNNFQERGTFHRKDVFKFLDESFQEKNIYDAVFCDPPAFAKSAGQTNQALEGYTKLHRKVFKILSSKSLVVFSSCTHYVDHDEFQKNILDAAVKENRNIQLIYSGMQGFDHPVKSLSDRSNYIKSYIYIVE
jgi:23S rRNA (cytosine1962-C5)-methyltransferase